MGVTLQPIAPLERVADAPPCRLAPSNLAQIYSEHSKLVWLMLSRLGVRDADLEDVLQEVFLVVFRRLDSIENEGALRSWLFSVCRRSAANYRRRAYRVHESVASGEEELDVVSDAASPEQDAQASEARATLEQVLSGLSDEKRVAFVMFEIEMRTSEEIADALGIPIGTVHSRIYSARKDVERIAMRLTLSNEKKR